MACPLNRSWGDPWQDEGPPFGRSADGGVPGRPIGVVLSQRLQAALWCIHKLQSHDVVALFIHQGSRIYHTAAWSIWAFWRESLAIEWLLVRAPLVRELCPNKYINNTYLGA